MDIYIIRVKIFAGCNTSFYYIFIPKCLWPLSVKPAFYTEYIEFLRGI